MAISPENIIITAGTSPAMFLIFSSLLEPGDEIILPNPHYACYPNFIRFLGGKPIFIPVREENNFIYDVDQIKKSHLSSDKGHHCQFTCQSHRHAHPRRNNASHS
ncbi:MAG: hypothetical protein KIIPBIDF_02022 [Candidatus Methanoperedenaceae archaeon GB50]|nr:MAG: hypothetical protein KIIPBIDF_02022 [Candidatus Methanoperedenaceae archaeon GB50]